MKVVYTETNVKEIDIKLPIAYHKQYKWDEFKTDYYTLIYYSHDVISNICITYRDDELDEITFYTSDDISEYDYKCILDDSFNVKYFIDMLNNSVNIKSIMENLNAD